MKIKRWDILILIFALIAAIILFSVFRLFPSQEAAYVLIKQDGKVYGNYLLNENKEISIENAWGENQIVIRDGKVWVESADCRDKICVNHRPISQTKEVIVCLPHRLVIEIRADEGEVDALAK